MDAGAHEAPAIDIGIESPSPAQGGALTLLVGSLVCFYTEDDSSHPAATIEHRLELIQGVDTLHARLTLDTRFVDNTYGANAIGWDQSNQGKKPKPRDFSQLVGSDHAVLSMLDKTGAAVLKMKVDYISKDANATSGYATLGVSGGDGAMLEGPASAVRQVSTSLDRNLNERGYTAFLESSPPTDAQYTPSPAAPDWEFPVVYDVWVELSAFGAGFGDAHVEFIHASPSKTGENTVTVVRKDCPPDLQPPTSEVPPSDVAPPSCHLDSECEEGELCFGGECNESVELI